MENLIIGCRTLENELTAALSRCKDSYEIVWLDARLHNVRKKLKNAVQEILDTASGFNHILLATGFCGNAIAGLEVREIPLVIPRVDDCTSLLLGGYQNKLPWLDSYFLTEGWLKGDANIWNEYQYSLKKYGKEQTASIFSMMFANYRRLALLDTGCYDLNACMAQARQIGEALSLNLTVVAASIQYLQLLLTGPWDSKRFLLLPPHATLCPSDLSRIYQEDCESCQTRKN